MELKLQKKSDSQILVGIVCFMEAHLRPIGSVVSALLTPLVCGEEWYLAFHTTDQRYCCFPQISVEGKQANDVASAQ